MAIRPTTAGLQVLGALVALAGVFAGAKVPAQPVGVAAIGAAAGVAPEAT